MLHKNQMLQHKTCPTCHGEGRLVSRVEVAKKAFRVIKNDLKDLYISEDFAAFRVFLVGLHLFVSVTVLILRIVNCCLSDQNKLNMSSWSLYSTYWVWLIGLPLFYIYSVYNRAKKLTND